MTIEISYEKTISLQILIIISCGILSSYPMKFDSRSVFFALNFDCFPAV